MDDIIFAVILITVSLMIVIGICVTVLLYRKKQKSVKNVKVKNLRTVVNTVQGAKIILPDSNSERSDIINSYRGRRPDAPSGHYTADELD